MKKLLVLMLFLGIAVSANAATSYVDGIVTWSFNLGSMKVIGVGNGTTVYDGAIYGTNCTLTRDTAYTPVGVPGHIEALPLLAGPNGGDTTTISYDSTYIGWYTYAQDIGGATRVSSTDWFVFDVALTGGHTSGSVDVWNASNSWASSLGSFDVTPEPATMILLGLGGLFMRRRLA